MISQLHSSNPITNNSNAINRYFYARKVISSQFPRFIFPLQLPSDYAGQFIAFVLISDTTLFVMFLDLNDPTPKILFQKSNIFINATILDAQCHEDIDSTSNITTNPYPSSSIKKVSLKIKKTIPNTSPFEKLHQKLYHNDDDEQHFYMNDLGGKILTSSLTNRETIAYSITLLSSSGKVAVFRMECYYNISTRSSTIDTFTQESKSIDDNFEITLLQESRYRLSDYSQTPIQVGQFTFLCKSSQSTRCNWIVVWSIMGNAIAIDTLNGTSYEFEITSFSLLKELFLLENNLDSELLFLADLVQEKSRTLQTIKYFTSSLITKTLNEFPLKETDTCEINSVPDLMNTFTLYTDNFMKTIMINSLGKIQIQSTISPPSFKIQCCSILDTLDPSRKFLIITTEHKLYSAKQNIVTDFKELKSIATNINRMVIFQKQLGKIDQPILMVDDFGAVYLYLFNHSLNAIENIAMLSLGASVLDFTWIGQDYNKSLVCTNGWRQLSLYHCGLQNILHTRCEGFDGINMLWKLITDNGTQIFVFSFTSDTRTMMIKSDTLDDVSDISGLKSNTKSICVGILTGTETLVQVYRYGIISKALDAPYSSRIRWKTKDEIHSACFDGSHVLFCTFPDNELYIVDLETDSIEPSHLTNLNSEATCIYPFPHASTSTRYSNLPRFYIIGCVDGSVLYIEISHDNQVTIHFTIEMHGQSTPNSFLKYDETHLLIGSRDGKLVILEDYEKGLTSPFSIYTIGHAPVALNWNHSASSSTENTTKKHTEFFIQCDQLWSSFLDGSGLNYKVVVKEQCDAFTSFDQNRILIIRNGVMDLLQLEERPHFTSIFSSKKMPRRIVYDEKTTKLVVAVTEITPTSLRGCIEVVDLQSGQILLTEKLSKLETIHSLFIWNVKEDKRYICVGTGSYYHNERKVGRVIVYSLKAPSNGNPQYRIKQLGSFITENAVVQINSYMAGYLLVADGKRLVQLKIDAQTRVLIEGASIQFEYPIQSLAVRDTDILVASRKDSLFLCTYDTSERKFSIIRCEDASRWIMDCDIADGRTFVLSDRAGNIVVLGRGEGDYMYNVASYSSNEMIIKLSCGDQIAPSIQVSSEDPSSFTFSKFTSIDRSRVFSELENDYNPVFIRGVSILGSLFAFQSISQTIYNQLSLLYKVWNSFQSIEEDHEGNSNEDYGHVNVFDSDLLDGFLSATWHEKLIIASNFNDLWKEEYPFEQDKIVDNTQTCIWFTRLLRYLNQTSL